MKSSSRSFVIDEEYYRAGMVLGGVGDAFGHRWEFCDKGRHIHSVLKDTGGVKNINVKDWIVSDNTVMHLATSDALIENKRCENKDNLYILLAGKYKEYMNDMGGRSAGNTFCVKMCKELDTTKPHGYRLPFNSCGGSCGAAMRSMCIGLRYPGFRDIEDLIEISIESGRMTHHHPTGYLGSLASALFASYAVQRKPLKEWGAGLMDTLKQAKKYIISCKEVYVKENVAAWGYFETKWEEYLKLRNILNGCEEPLFLDYNDVDKREEIYCKLSYADTGGTSGHHEPMIAYDALLASKDSWEELCNRAMFHGGDSASTGSIAGCLFGILYGLKCVPKNNYRQLEYRNRLEQAGSKLFSFYDSNELAIEK